jgi:hypothetical protein
MSLPELKVAVLNLGTSAVLTLDGHLNALTVGVLESSLDGILVGPEKPLCWKRRAKSPTFSLPILDC